MAAAQAACTGRARLKAVGARARAERTLNMLSMVVTSDVSKLSRWLKADASCRVGKRAHAVRGEVRPAEGGRAWSSGGTQAARTRLESEVYRLYEGEAQCTRQAHVEHAVHGRDLGRVEAEPLVEG